MTTTNPASERRSAATPTATDDFTSTLTATCHCGRLHVQLPSKPTLLNECHCTVCYKYGALWAYFPRRDVVVTTSAGTSVSTSVSTVGSSDGVGKSQAYIRADEGADGDISFNRCAHCGCMVFWWGEREYAGPEHKMGVNCRMLPEEEIQGIEKKVSKGPSYYYGCSTGDRQGLQSTQIFPEDFDRIIASSAAVDFNGLVGWSGSFFVTTGPIGSPHFLSSGQWNAVGQAVTRECDGIDGVTDGIIEDPDLCNFDPNTLLYREGSHPQTCLSKNHADTVSKVLSALRDDDKNLTYPALQPGVEAASFGGYLNGSPSPIPTQWYENAVFNEGNYDPSKLNVCGIILGKTLDLATISSFSGNLSAFKNNGGKLIALHGLADSTITSTNSERYYKHVSATMNLPPVELDDFFRYFRISGMGHCGSGPGAWEIGLTGSSVPSNAQQNVLFALFEWVEKGTTPDTLLGTKYEDDHSANGIKFQRNHCRYPYRTVYVGGNSRKPESWSCHPVVDMDTPMEEDT